MRAVRAGAVPALFLLWAGFAGIDFGYHWDEELMFQQVRRAATAPGTLLPGRYHYPSLTFWLSLAGLAPEVVRNTVTTEGNPSGSVVRAVTQTEAYRLRVRGIFLVATAAAVIATAGLALALSGSGGEALLAAALLATSWEIGYHARWIAPDGVVMTFTTLAVLASVRSLSRGSSAWTWLRAAAAAAGLAIGTKYTAWPFLLTVAAAAAMNPALGPPRERTRRIGRLVGIAAVIYLVTTPGTLLQPVVFVKGVFIEAAHYSAGHDRHTIAAGPVHLWRMLVYLTAVLISPYPAAAIGWSALSIVGTCDRWRRARDETIVLLIGPTVYVLWFASQRVMIVRNLLMVAPVIAVLAARGAAALWVMAGTRPAARVLRPALAGALSIALAVTVAFDIAAVDSIRHRRDRAAAAEFGAWVRTHPDRPVVVSTRLEADLTRAGVEVPRADARSASMAFYSSEQDIESNHLGIFEAVFGPRDANLEFYTDWAGNGHILLIAPYVAERLGIQVR